MSYFLGFVTGVVFFIVLECLAEVSDRRKEKLDSPEKREHEKRVKELIEELDQQQRIAREISLAQQIEMYKKDNAEFKGDTK